MRGSHSVDKAPLSQDRGRRPRPYRETPQVSAAVQRLVAAVGVRVGRGDPEDLLELVAVHQTLERAFEAAITGLRASGRSDAEIGQALGVTKQAVAQHWPRGQR